MRRSALGWVLGVVAAACASGTTENSIIATSSTYGSQVEEEAVLGGEDEQAMDSVTVGGPGLVAVGFDAPGDDGDAAVWTSPDGLSWTRGSCRSEPLITLT